MRLRPFIPSTDFDIIKNWITDERTHAMWCANRFSYPLERSNFISVIEAHSARKGDVPFVATSDDGKIVGFFCYSLNIAENEGMLKFVMVDPQRRGRGTAREMLALAVKYAFEITKAASVQLYVFTENIRAVKCYKNVGFTERHTDREAFRFGNEYWGRCNMVIKK